MDGKVSKLDREENDMKIQRFNELIQACEWGGNEVVIDMGYGQLHNITGIRVENGKLVIIPDYKSLKERMVEKEIKEE